MKHPTRRSWVSTGLLMAISAGTVLAQPAQPSIRTVTFVTLKADRIGDYLAARRELAAALQKAGAERGYTMWASLSGPREFAIVSYQSKWGEMDNLQDPKLKDIQGQLSALTARANAAVESTRRVIYGLEPDLSLPLPTGAPQPIARVLRTYVRPEHAGAYTALIKSEIVPAWKKAGAKLMSTARVRFGGSNYEYSSVTGLDKWADLDSPSPLIAAMGGQAAYDKFLAKLRPMIVRSEYDLYRFQPEQSYTPPAR